MFPTAGTVLTIKGGANQGIAPTWHATLIDPQGEPMPDVTLEIVRVADAVTIVRAPGSNLGMKATKMRVRVEP